MKPTKTEIETWVTTLRSGKFNQSTACLQNSAGYCCLGVACELFIAANKKVTKSDGFLSGGYPISQPDSPKWLHYINNNFEQITGTALAHLNDLGIKFEEKHEKLSFDEIADLLELVYIHNAFGEIA